MDNLNTKEKILDVSYEMIANIGYDKASLALIAEKVGIKKASIYYYFKSKEEILLELVKRSYKDDITNEFSEFNNKLDHASYNEAFIKMGESLIDSYYVNPIERKFCAEVDLLTTRLESLDKLTDELDLQLVKALERVLVIGKGEGYLAKDLNPRDEAEVLYTFFTGLDAVILYDFPLKVRPLWHTLAKHYLKKVK